MGCAFRFFQKEKSVGTAFVILFIIMESSSRIIRWNHSKFNVGRGCADSTVDSTTLLNDCLNFFLLFEEERQALDFSLESREALTLFARGLGKRAKNFALAKLFTLVKIQTMDRICVADLKTILTREVKILSCPLFKLSLIPEETVKRIDGLKQKPSQSISEYILELKSELLAAQLEAVSSTLDEIAKEAVSRFIHNRLAVALVGRCLPQYKGELEGRAAKFDVANGSEYHICINEFNCSTFLAIMNDIEKSPIVIKLNETCADCYGEKMADSSISVVSSPYCSTSVSPVLDDDDEVGGIPGLNYKRILSPHPTTPHTPSFFAPVPWSLTNLERGQHHFSYRRDAMDPTINAEISRDDSPLSSSSPDSPSNTPTPPPSKENINFSEGVISGYKRKMPDDEHDQEDVASSEQVDWRSAIICRRFSSCKRRNCLFKHPEPVLKSTIDCKNGFACRRNFKGKCPYKHPSKSEIDCNFGASCKRTKCPFKHTPKIPKIVDCRHGFNCKSTQYPSC